MKLSVRCARFCAHIEVFIPLLPGFPFPVFPSRQPAIPVCLSPHICAPSMSSLPRPPRYLCPSSFSPQLWSVCLALSAQVGQHHPPLTYDRPTSCWLSWTYQLSLALFRRVWPCCPRPVVRLLHMSEVPPLIASLPPSMSSLPALPPPLNPSHHSFLRVHVRPWNVFLFDLTPLPL